MFLSGLIQFANFTWYYLFSERPLEGLHIVVDAGNGAGGFFAVGFIRTLYFNIFSIFSSGVRI